VFDANRNLVERFGRVADLSWSRKAAFAAAVKKYSETLTICDTLAASFGGDRPELHHHAHILFVLNGLLRRFVCYRDSAGGRLAWTSTPEASALSRHLLKEA